MTKLRIYRKESDTLEIISSPEDSIERGNYLIVEDLESDRALVIQVVDIQFANLPGILEDLLRDQISTDEVFGDDHDPLGLTSQITKLRDIRLLIGKIRASLHAGQISRNISWLPTRANSSIRKIEADALLQSLKIGLRRPIVIGTSGIASEVRIDADSLDGKLTVILGKKGTGKSNLSKVLLLGLVDQNAPCVVFDPNGEYVNLNLSSKGEKNSYDGRIFNLQPGKNFRVSLRDCTSGVLVNILTNALGLPSTSTREFHRLWRYLEQRGLLTLDDMAEALTDWDCHESVRDALISRFNTLLYSGFFSDDTSNGVQIDSVFEKLASGGLLVLNLKESSAIERRIVVEFMLGKLVELLRNWRLKALFLFAEEAHLYLRETYWEDIVTRMRHLGLFATFITNQPDSIAETVYRQADSIFLFNFKNEHDLSCISRVARVDSTTMNLIAGSLEPHHCLILGEATSDLPLVVKVKELEVQALGETRKFFD